MLTQLPAYNTAFLIGNLSFPKADTSTWPASVDPEPLANLWSPPTSNSSEHQSVQPSQNKAYLVLRLVDRQCGRPCLGACAWRPPDPSGRLKAAAARGDGRRLSSGVLGFSDIVGWDVALPSVNFSQPPLCIACDVFKLKDPESLIG